MMGTTLNVLQQCVVYAKIIVIMSIVNKNRENLIFEKQKL